MSGHAEQCQADASPPSACEIARRTMLPRPPSKVGGTPAHALAGEGEAAHQSRHASLSVSCCGRQGCCLMMLPAMHACSLAGKQLPDHAAGTADPQCRATQPSYTSRPSLIAGPSRDGRHKPQSSRSRRIDQPGQQPPGAVGLSQTPSSKHPPISKPSPSLHRILGCLQVPANPQRTPAGHQQPLVRRLGSPRWTAA